MSEISRGENAGRTLEHFGVVRGLKSIEATGPASGEAKIALPEDAELTRCHVIAFAQHQRSLRVVGAAQSNALAQPVRNKNSE